VVCDSLNLFVSVTEQLNSYVVAQTVFILVEKPMLEAWTSRHWFQWSK